MLDIRSPLKKQALKHNVIDRDKVLVPPNWDSWGKIGVLREGFDIEGTSNGWSIDIKPLSASSDKGNKEADRANDTTTASPQTSSSPEGAVLPNYESTITNPRTTRSSHQPDQPPRIEVSVKPTQEFLAAQIETITRLQSEDEKASSKTPSTPLNSSNRLPSDHMHEHIGPIQVNMGGIQVDADDMLKRLKNRDREQANKSTSDTDPISGVLSQTPEEQKLENEKLNSFFANLVKRGASGSPRGTPGRAASGKETPTKLRE